MNIILVETPEQLSHAVSKIVAEVLSSKPNAVLGLSADIALKGVYENLVRLHQEHGLDFSQIRAIVVGEYIGLRGTHDQSSSYFMNRHFFKQININPKCVYIPSATYENHAAICAEFEKVIRNCGGIDLQILSIGPEAELAFNESPSSFGSRTHVRSLAEHTVDGHARFFERRANVPIHVITMGIGTILEANRLLLMASGKNRAEAVAKAVEGPQSITVPASALQLHADIMVLLDKEAASALSLIDHYRWVQKMRPILRGHNRYVMNSD